MHAYTRYRWESVVAIALIVGIAGGSLSALTPPLVTATSFAAWLGRLSPTASYGIMASLVGVLLMPLLVLAPLHLSHIRLSLRYPSIWIAVALAIPLTIFVHLIAANWALEGHPLTRYSNTSWTIATALLLIGFLAAQFILLIARRTPPEPALPHPHEDQTHSRLSDFASDPSRLLQWVSEREHPINTPENDAFSFRVISRRIADRLLSEEDPSFGISGVRGAGKSSVVSMAEHYCVERRNSSLHPHLWFCRVSCWMFHDSRAALRYILDRVVDTVSRHADALALRGLPQSYIDLVSNAAGWIRSLLSPLEDSGGARDRLGRLSPIVRACNARVVLVVEDLDRNQSRDFDLQQVLAVLDQLRSVSGLSFILTGDRAEFDFGRLCDHIELMPRLNVGSTWQAITTFRSACASRYNDIDPASEERRGELWHEASRQQFLAYLIGPDARHSVPEAILTLLGSPRALRHTLRLTLRASDRLHGEVDFDELLAINTLRTGASQVFEFLMSHYRDLRRVNDQRGGTNWQKMIDEEWRRVAAAGQFDVHSATILVSFLFPTNRESREFPETYPGGRQGEVPQGVRHREPHDYFERLMAEDVPPEEVRDQEVLSMVRRARNSGELSDLARRIVECPEFATTWEFLAVRSVPSARLAGEQLLPLASEAFRVELDGRKGRANGENPGILSIWRLANRATHAHRDASAWLVEEVRRASAVSIPFLTNLYYYWGSLRYGVVPHESREMARDEARRVAHAALREHWEGAEGREFADAACGDSRNTGYELYHLVFPPDRDEAVQSPLREASDWEWMGPVIRRAMRVAPENMTRRVLQLVHARTADGSPRRGFDDHVIEGIFSTRDARSEVIRLIHENADYLAGLPDVDLREVRESACEWLRQHDDAP